MTVITIMPITILIDKYMVTYKRAHTDANMVTDVNMVAYIILHLKSIVRLLK